MNEIRRIVPEAEEIDAIRSIVERHALPNFVSGFDLKLGDYDEEPIVTINFHISGEWPREIEARKSKARALYDLSKAVQQDLSANYSTRYPYFDFGHEPHTA